MRTRQARRIRQGVERAMGEALFGISLGLSVAEVTERHSRWVMPDRLAQRAYLQCLDRATPHLQRVHRRRREPLQHRRTWRAAA